MEQPAKLSLMFETADGKRDFVTVALKGLNLAIHANITELKEENNEALTKRIRREFSHIIDRPAFPTQEAFDQAVAQTTNQIIGIMKEQAAQLDGVKLVNDDQGRITKTLVHKSLGDAERRAVEVLHNPAKFKAPFLVEIANQEGLHFVVTEKSTIASVIPPGQRNPEVEARTVKVDHPETGERLLQTVYISTAGQSDDPTPFAGNPFHTSPQIRLINGFAHEVIHNTKLEHALSAAIESQGVAAVDRLIRDDIAHLEEVDAKLKRAAAASGTQDFTSLSKMLDLGGALKPLFELALEGYNEKTRDNPVSAHDLREAVSQGKLPDQLPEGTSAEDYAKGLKLIIADMSKHMALPVRMMNNFPPDRYPDRNAVVREYPGQVYSMMALKGVPVVEALLPRLTPLIAEATKREYGVDIHVAANQTAAGSQEKQWRR